MKPTPKPRVLRCVPRHDGGYLIVPTQGQTAVSDCKLEEGAKIVIRDGKAFAA